MELLNCSVDGWQSGCCITQGHLTATNVTVTNSVADGFQVLGGNAELRGCSVTGSSGACGMHFNTILQPSVATEPVWRTALYRKTAEADFVRREVHRWL